MAKPVKQLRDLLQEKQEPFMLDLYLLEKGYRRKSFNCGNSIESCDLERRQKGILQYSKVLKAVCNSVVSLNERLRTKSSNAKDETPELDRVSSASSSTVFDSCTVSDGEEASISKQKQHVTISPISVLEQVASNREGTKNSSSTKRKTGTIGCTLSPKKVTKDSILSASLWKILFQSAREKPTLAGVSDTQELVHLKSKKVLRQTRQLLFDCVIERVETQERKKDKQQLGTKEEFIEEKIKCWGKQCGEESKLGQWLESDFRKQEWIGLKPVRRKIGCEIGDAILVEILNEIVRDMVDF